MTTPLVSVICTIYNHRPFIEQAIESFLMQQTNFPFEIILHDDASTDGTSDIIRTYAAKHPDLIVPVIQTENQYSKGVMPLGQSAISYARGKYVAWCEGDDYWIDPLKLQKQIAAQVSARQVGRTINVLVEEPGVARGESDAPDIDGRIYLPITVPVGDFATVQITGYEDYDLLALPVGQEPTTRKVAKQAQ